MSLHEKQVLANQLRGELSALRLERESVLQGTHDVAVEEQLDAENKRLRLEIETERNALTDAAGGDGSVAAAISAMYEAAEVEVAPGSTEAVTTETKKQEEQPATASTPRVPKAAALDIPVQTSGEEK